MNALSPGHPLPMTARAVMAERTRRLARRALAPPLASTMVTVMTFRLGSERYGIEIRHIHEVVRLDDLTLLPGTPAFVSGLINRRGELLVVFDLRQLLAVAPAAAVTGPRVMVLGGQRAELGLMTDTVGEVITLPNESVLAPPLAGVRREWLRGVTADALSVLDGAALLSDPSLFIDQEDAVVASASGGGA